MAARTTRKTYTSKAITTKITGTSRASVKIQDTYYTFECNEERTIPEDAKSVNLGKEWELLFESLNASIDAQVEDVLNTYKDNDITIAKAKKERQKKQTNFPLQ